MASNVYLDESGDLGWVLDKPFRNGGSSRYLTIAFVVCPAEKKHLLQRIVVDMYRRKRFDPKQELKGNNLTVPDKCFFAEKVRKLVSMNPDISVGAITVNKSKVRQHIREDSNKLYNYMIRLAVLPAINGHELVNLIRDNKTVKVKSGNSLIDYLQTVLWFDYDSHTKIKDIPSDSKRVKNLIFIDWMNNLIWGRYEDNNTQPYDILKNVITSRKLFF
ncbi:MAG: DUF3800 domain-containing protein [Duncaniella sp.]|uniref:DUF3800 domain-containing protein n=1 Tax=Duncaniella sp. TaxID=2518496 RepID=UPI0023BE764D|nr:DUF3800 domain-containing protein [Duncaniella sp.]MDE6089855.1 DUF3800 domain-containing protein [Duncaniella sp.]